MPLLSTLAAAASSKAAVGLATAALVVGGGTAAAAAVATDSTDPGVWGKTVTEAVATCKSQLGDGEHGIGQCVSAAAKKHGQEQRDAHAAGQGQGNAPSPHPGRTGHPTPAATEHSAGKPSGVPVGPPTTPVAGEGSHPTGPPVVPPTPRHT